MLERLKTKFGDSIIESRVFRGEDTVIVSKGALLEILTYLRDDSESLFDTFVDVIGVDYLNIKASEERFEIVYHLYSTVKRHRIRVKTSIADGETLPTSTDLWIGADWPEREVYDMFGIKFSDHPDMRRIYLAHDWEGFPLRKDYPLKGYKDEYNPYGEERN